MKNSAHSFFFWNTKCCTLNIQLLTTSTFFSSKFGIVLSSLHDELRHPAGFAVLIICWTSAEHVLICEVRKLSCFYFSFLCLCFVFGQRRVINEYETSSVSLKIFCLFFVLIHIWIGIGYIIGYNVYIIELIG